MEAAINRKNSPSEKAKFFLNEQHFRLLLTGRNSWVPPGRQFSETCFGKLVSSVLMSESAKG